MRKVLWLQTLASLLMVMRILLFEKYEGILQAVWWLFIILLAGIFYWFDYRVAIAVTILGVLTAPLFQQGMRRLKPVLLRSGDKIEYVIPNAALQEQFSTAVLIAPIAKEEVAKRNFFDATQIDEYTRFYLISAGKESRAVPYEWIMGIEPEELPLP